MLIRLYVAMFKQTSPLSALHCNESLSDPLYEHTYIVLPSTPLSLRKQTLFVSADTDRPDERLGSSSFINSPVSREARLTSIDSEASVLSQSVSQSSLKESLFESC